MRARAERRGAVRAPARLDPATRLAERSTARTARSAATQAHVADVAGGEAVDVLLGHLRARVFETLEDGVFGLGASTS